MKSRIISALILLPFVIGALYLGGVVLTVAIALAATIGLWEFFRAFKVKDAGLKGLAYGYGAMVFLLYELTQMDGLLYLTIILILGYLAIYALKYPSVSIPELGTVIFALVYVVGLIMTILYIRGSQAGDWLIWWLFVIAFGSDSSAYFVGVNFGKHKLVPHLSPNKTIEGGLGGLVGAGLLSMVYGLLLSLFGFDSIPSYGILFAGGFFGSIVSQIGDLVGSAMKRQCGIKDFSRIIPGHGGILDRLDSLLTTAPYVFLIAVIFAWL